MSLRPCRQCARHVRDVETSCPFCAAALAPAPVTAPRRVGRIGRAAIVAFGAMSAAGAAGCSETNTVMDAAGGDPADTGRASDDAARPPLDAPAPDPDSGNIAPPYGAPSEDAGVDTGAPIAAYGGPTPVVDAGPEDDTGAVVNLYGGAGF